MTVTVSSAEARHAYQCRTSVVAESEAPLHVEGGIAVALKAELKYEGRYDLLAVPNLNVLMCDPESLRTLTADIAAAIDLHQVERVLVVTRSVSPHYFIRRLLEMRPELRNRVIVTGQRLVLRRADRLPETLVVSCMDWRQHGDARLATEIAATFGIRRFDLMATAGGAKELASGHRANFAARQIALLVDAGLQRLILLSHSDCGKYGGSCSFADYGEECRAIAHDLHAAATILRNAHPALDVRLGRVEIEHRHLARIVAI